MTDDDKTRTRVEIDTKIFKTVQNWQQRQKALHRNQNIQNQLFD